MSETKDFHSSNSVKNCFADFITGKVESLGSTFSNETPTGGCLRPHATIDKSIIKLFYTVPINAQSDTLAPLTTIPQDQLVSLDFPYTNKYPFQYDLPHKYPP